MEWLDCSILLHLPGGLDSKDFNDMEDMLFIQTEDEFFGEDWLNCYATEILDTKYESTDMMMLWISWPTSMDTKNEPCFECFK